MQNFTRRAIAWSVTLLVMAALATVGGTIGFFAAAHLSLLLDVDLEGGYGDHTAAIWVIRAFTAFSGGGALLGAVAGFRIVRAIGAGKVRSGQEEKRQA